MKRPDQDRFELFTKQFEALDPFLTRFGVDHGFQLERNVNRYPCRILRRRGNPQFLIDIYQDDHWLQVDYRSDLPYSIAAAAFYVPPENTLQLWKLSKVIVGHKSFTDIERRIREYMNTALEFSKSLSSEIILQQGQCLRNLKAENERGLL
jgi:hypothetical protein